MSTELKVHVTTNSKNKAVRVNVSNKHGMTIETKTLRDGEAHTFNLNVDERIGVVEVATTSRVPEDEQ